MLVSAWPQHESAISIHVPPPSCTAFPPLIPHSQVITKHQAEIPVLHSSSPLAIHFIHGRWIGSIYEALRKWQAFSTISTNVIYFLGHSIGHSVLVFVCLLGLFFFFFWVSHKGCGILVPRPGIKPRPWHWEWEVLGNSLGWTVLISTWQVRRQMPQSS